MCVCVCVCVCVLCEGVAALVMHPDTACAVCLSVCKLVTFLGVVILFSVT